MKPRKIHVCRVKRGVVGASDMWRSVQAERLHAQGRMSYEDSPKQLYMIRDTWKYVVPLARSG